MMMIKGFVWLLCCKVGQMYVAIQYQLLFICKNIREYIIKKAKVFF